MIQALPYDNKMLTKGYLENLERTLKGNAKKGFLVVNGNMMMILLLYVTMKEY